MAIHKMQGDGAWLLTHQRDEGSPPPSKESWDIRSGVLTDAPKGLKPGPGQVLILVQGYTVIVITPD